MKKSIISLWMTWIVLGMMSCESDHYDMLTQIYANGSCSRVVMAKADSAFMVGDTTHNPFLFTLGPVWKIDWQLPSGEWSGEWPLKVWERDSVDERKEAVVRAVANYHSADELGEAFRFSRKGWESVTPKVLFTKRFRWFYTYYTFQETYPRIENLGRIPVDRYMTGDELKLWFEGDQSICKGMNGIEMKEVLDRVELKFELWFNRNLYEVGAGILFDFASRGGELHDEVGRLMVAKDSIFNEHTKSNFSLGDISQMFDQYLNTTDFSDLYWCNKLAMDSINEKELAVINMFGNSITYDLVMPGRVLSANTELVAGDTLTWRVDAYRFAVSDLTISARSRKANSWAFIVSIFIIAVIGISWFSAGRRD